MSKFIIVCPECKGEDLEIWDGGSEEVYRCANCHDENSCVPLDYLLRKHEFTEWTKLIETKIEMLTKDNIW